MSAPLSNVQKRYLSQLARRAYAKAGADADTLSADDYRHAEVARASGKLGLRCCSQDDYKIVEAHFLNLLGETGRAMTSLVRHQTNPRRVAEHKLVQACAEAKVTIGYAASICRSMFKCSLDDATPDQLWKLKFTINNRARKVTFREEKQAA
jgi:hypothetical protein